MKRGLIIILLIIVLAGAAYFGYSRYQEAQAATQSSFQTEKLAMGDLTATVGATGIVHSNQTTTVNWQTTGRIGKIFVKVGDKVTANQVLAELDSTSLPQNIISARSDLVTAQRNLENLKNSTTARSQAQQNLANAQKALTDAKTDRFRKNLARVSQATIDAAQADLIIAKDSLKSAQENYDKFVNRPADDLMRAQAFNRLAQAQQKVDQNQYNLDWLIGSPDPLEVSQADAAIVVAQSKLDDAQREWDRLKNGPDPQDLAAAQARIDSIQAIQAQTQVKAPINGTVTDVNAMTGDQVSPGSVSFRIDDLSHLLVDVQITEVDINRVQVGQSAKMTFDAILNKEYNGKVTEVSSFGTNQSGLVNFTVTVELTDADAQVRPGMTAAVNLTVQQLNNILLVPNRAVRLQNGKRVVYLLELGQPRIVEITIGATSDTYSQVLRGDAKAGDEIILNPPLQLPTGPTGGFGSFGAGR
jgi:HlyD family secretion protein